MIKFSRFYIDPELQFPVTLSLLIAVMVQSLLFCWGIYEIVSVTGQWVRQDQMLSFFKFILLAAFATIILIVFINFVTGIYLSYKIAEPLDKIRRAMREISHGNLEVSVEPEEGRMLESHTDQFNDMAERLRHLIYRDYQYTQEADEAMTLCQRWVQENKTLSTEERKELQFFIKDVKSKLSIINSYFMRGKQDKS